jgi:O-antigen/teichoic acid export membrane protein
MKFNSMTKRAVFLRGFASGVSAQIISVVVGLASIAIGLAYLGPIKFGIWTVISSIVAYLGLSQFGTGTAAATLIAKHIERGSQGVVLRHTFRLLCYFSLFLIGFVGVAAMFPQVWAVLFGDIPTAARHEAISAVLAMMVLYMLRLPTVAFTSAFIGLQEVHWERLYAVVLPVLLSFLALLLTIYLAGGLVMLACLTGGAQLLAGLLAGIHFSLRHRDMLHGTTSKASDAAMTKDLLANGSRFFVIGIAAMVVWNTDNLVISYFLGPEHVTAYAITFKLFASAFSIFILANSVLMPMFGNAFGRNDWVWINGTYRNALSIMAMLGGLVWIGGIVYAEPIIVMWTGKAGFGGLLVVFALGGYGYILSAVNLHANLLSGMNATRAMLWIGIAEAVINFVLSMIFIRWWGIGGVALGTFLSALLTVYWLLPKDVARQTQSRVKVGWTPIMRHFWLAVLPGIGVAYFISSLMHGVVIWVAGIALCVAYLAISWLLLPQQAQAMLMRIGRINSRFSSEGIK